MKAQTIAKLLTAGGLAGLAALLWYYTLAVQQVECEVCMSFADRHACAVAAAETEAAAIHGARTTACGLIASGVRDSFACDATEPASKKCRAG